MRGERFVSGVKRVGVRLPPKIQHGKFRASLVAASARMIRERWLPAIS